MGQRNKGMMENWNNGMMETAEGWNKGIMENWDDGTMEPRKGGRTEEWSKGIKE
jgi:hypothetical protein